MAVETRLLKANQLRNLGAKVAFNFEDLRTQCDEYLATVRAQADQILTQAQRDAQQLREQAQAAGVAAGRQAGLQHSDEQITARARELADRLFAERTRQSLPALEAVIRNLQSERERWLATWEAAAIQLAVGIAERILRQQLAQQPALALPSMREALQLAAGQPHLKVHLHPHDLELLQQSGLSLSQRLGALGQAELIPDEGLSRGGCYLETEHGVIDARLETQLERITAELTAA